ncbi:hypothetical protein CDL15_Pgr015011 [Punica granatum]|uniref:Regulator of telomere elongation helicase 1 homolog n=1 Tax=Punica granatum TaxID=22663 RepID=A0A218X1H6_PUNGR|nr:hypothetical protein CDL15_Pgr015011 [Punica granatum]
MPTYKIRGVDVDFPFEAYDCQLVYMEKVIQSLQERCNALLESPTGTGKTLCLLCATLGWRKSLGSFSTGSMKGESQDQAFSQSQSDSNKLPTIVYTSRTHSQLRQVIQELRRSNYRPKMVVLGSREQLCIHEEVSSLRGRAQNSACHYLCRKGAKRRCKHYFHVAEYMKSNPYLGDDPIDIEDLVNIGRKSGPCPYYLSRELHKSVDIIFAPYNYLIDNAYRKSLAVDWTNTVLIFDEAHNLESLCADAASFDLPSHLLTACISEAKNCIDHSVSRREQSNDKSRNPDNFAILRALLLKLEKRIMDVPIESKESGFTKPGPYIYELFSDLNITHETASMLIATIEDAAVLLEESNQLQSKGNICRLETMGEILKLIFKEKNNAHAKYYRVHVREVEAHFSDSLKGKASRSLSWWCFKPGIAMEEFSKMGVGSIILTSGTLSPLDSFAQELNLKFPIRLENPHVISSDQLWAGVVPVGPSGCSFNSSYRNRDSLEYKQDLGNAIVNFARIVPDGLLVFFPSYYALEQCIACWKDMAHPNSTDSRSIWERICRHKFPVVEPRQSSVFSVSIEDYMSKLKDPSSSGAVFFAVCRGKVSEGLDFADHAGRAVVITGLPFATRTDPKVRLKRDYLDEHAWSQNDGNKGLTGEEWYSQQASRAVNQAVGRVIRHRDDYGAIIFCDERFAQSQRQSQISLWIQPHIKCYSRFGDVIFTLTRFFRDARTRPCNKSTVQNSESGKCGEMRALESQENRLSPHATLKLEDQINAMESTSSFLETKSWISRNHFEEVLPANRSSLAANKKIQESKWVSSEDLLHRGKSPQISGSKILQRYSKTIDLTDDTLLDKKPSMETLTPCALKRKLPSSLENSEMLTSGSGLQSERHVSAKLGKDKDDSWSRRNAQVGSAHMSKKDGHVQGSNLNIFDRKDKVVQQSQDPLDDEEARGSAFLIQVREKLNATEYKEFVGFMKALKSNAMKIGFVLQSIARLFSGPERLPLSIRFKDFIPAKYRLLYEPYLGANDMNSSAPK